MSTQPMVQRIILLASYLPNLLFTFLIECMNLTWNWKLSLTLEKCRIGLDEILSLRIAEILAHVGCNVLLLNASITGHQYRAFSSKFEDSNIREILERYRLECSSSINICRAPPHICAR